MKKPKSSIILYSETGNALRSGTILSLPSDIVLEVLARVVKQAKEEKASRLKRRK